MHSIDNIELILSNDKNLKNKFALDTFDSKIWIHGELPWDRKHKTKRQWEDFDDAGLRAYLEKNYGITHRNNTYDAWEVVVRKNKYNSVAKY